MFPNTLPTDASQERIRAFVRNQDVRWRRQPLVSYAAARGPMQYGFTIELHAAHVRPKHAPRPGCDECQELYDGLAELARAVIPPVLKDTLFEVYPFRGELVFAPSRGGREEVVLDIDVVHRTGVGPVDECELACLARLKARLADLGARRL